jgi:hypothetical protein
MTGQVMTGLVMSLTVTVKLQGVLLLPEASLAVYVTVVVPIGNELPGEWDLVHKILPEGVQLSVAVGSVQLTVAAQLPGILLTAIFEGQPDITGAIGSTTVTVELQVALPYELATVRMTLLVPKSEQVNAVLLSVFVTPQFKLLPLSTIGTVSVAFPELLRLSVAFLHRATIVDSVALAV